MKIWTKRLEKLYRAVIGREDREEAEKTPSYEQIFCAYARCFKWRDGAYYVGNHRLCDTLSRGKVVATLAYSKANGHPLLLDATCMMSDEYILFLDAIGEVLNRNIPLNEVQPTAQNFACELSREYSKHLKDVLAEAGS
jgi:hypothetical protein